MGEFEFGKNVHPGQIFDELEKPLSTFDLM